MSNFEITVDCSTSQGSSVNAVLSMELGNGLAPSSDDLVASMRDAIQEVVGSYVASNVQPPYVAHSPTATAKETGLTRSLS